MSNRLPSHRSPSTPASATPGFAGRAELLLRPAAERFHSQHDWLDSWHSFSFANHHDPAWMGFGPLRVINDDRIAAGRGFGMHRHQDMEIITVMVAGELRHQDSIGHRSTLHAGEVQCMSAGTGLLHSEINGSDQSCRLLQIWIEPSRQGLPPSYQQKPFPPGAGWSLLIDPDASQGAMAIQRPVRLWRGQPPAGSSLDLPLAAGSQGWIQMISGELEFRVHGPSGASTGRLRQGDGLGLLAAQSANQSANRAASRTAASRTAALTAGPRASLTALASGADLLCFELG